MPKSIALSCPLCLTVNDPDDLLEVVIPHSAFPGSAPPRLCRLCVIEIMKAAFASDLISPEEVLPGAANLIDDAPGGAGPAAAPAADPALVSENQPGAEAAGVDRREPEVPAGGPGEPPADEEG
jgi:hypothetical protein